MRQSDPAPPAGPVTAVAVLPNTSLVLSASQDGTLRTWDLQAAAQVGEVALSCWDRSVPPESVSRLLAPAGPGWPLLSLRLKCEGRLLLRYIKLIMTDTEQDTTLYR